MSSKLIRTAYLGTDSTNPNTDNNRQVNIHLTNGVPLVSIDDEIISDRLIKEELYTGGTLRVIPNILVDREDANRFIYVTQIISPISKDKSNIYYDGKYKDIIIIPETKYLGTGDINDINANQTFDLAGYVVSGNSEFKNDVFTGTINPDTVMNLPETNRNINSRSMVASIYGISNTMGNRIVSYPMATNMSIRDRRMLPIGIIDLGTITDLFTVSTLIPTYSMYQSSYNMFKIRYLGNKKPSKVYILIDF